MMGNSNEAVKKIDDVSEAIGGLKAIAESIEKKIDNVDRSVTDLIRSDGAQEAAIKSAHKRIDDMGIVWDAMNAVVKEHEALKNKAFGIIAVLGVVVGAIGAGLSKLVSMWMSHGN